MLCRWTRACGIASRLTDITGPAYSFCPLKMYIATLMMKTAEKMTTLQLKVVRVTGVLVGQNEKKKAKATYTRAAAFTQIPYFPMLHRCGGSVSGQDSLRYSRQPIDTTYVHMSAATFREIIAWNAVSEPILIKAKRPLMTQDSPMAFTGSFRFGLTLQIHLANGKPLSRANA